jgi:choline dehydrogenase
LVLEAGKEQRGIWSRIPIGYAMTYSDQRYVRKYFTEPDRGLNGRKDYWCQRRFETDPVIGRSAV